MPTIREIARVLSNEDSLVLLSEEASDVAIIRPMPLREAATGEMTFCGASARNPQELLNQAKASLLIMDRKIPFDQEQLREQGVRALILSDNARLDFIHLVDKFFLSPRPRGIHPTAVISPAATIDPSVYIGPLCTIGNVEIGENTVVHAGVHIYDGVRVGRNVVIHSGTVIGADGFGFERNEAGEFEKFPHVGGVIIEDDVEICALTHIARGTLTDTFIGQGTKIDTFVHVAHNVTIGKHCAIISHAMLGGGITIGDFSWVAPSACIRDRITIGSDVTIGLGAVVTKDVSDGITVLGSPARELNEYKRLLTALKSAID